MERKRGCPEAFLFCGLLFLAAAVICCVLKIARQGGTALVLGGVFLFILMLPRIKRISTRYPGVAAAVISAAAILPRLLWARYVTTVPSGDFLTYGRLAVAISRGELRSDPLAPLRYVSIFPHTIAYPTVLGALYRMFGAGEMVAPLFAAFCCALTAILTGLIAEEISPGAFLPAGMIFALFPSQIYYTALLATEPLFLLFMSLSVYLFFKSVKITGLGLLSGLFAAFANAVRPVGAVLAAAALIFSFCAPLKKGGVVAFLIAYALTGFLISAGISKAIREDISTAPIGFNLYVGLNEEHDGRWNEEDGAEFSKVAAGGLSPGEVHGYFRKKSVKRIPENLKRAFSLISRKFSVMWGADDESLSYIKRALDVKSSKLAIGRSAPYLADAANLYFMAVLILAFISCARKQSGAAAYPVLILLGIAAVHIIFEAAGRYHAPALVPLCVAAAALPTTERL